MIASIQAMWGIFEYFDIIKQNGRFISGSFINVASYVTFISMGIPIMLQMIIKKRNIITTGIFMLMILLCVAAVYISESRTGLIAIVVMVSVFTIKKCNLKKQKLFFKFLYATIALAISVYGGGYLYHLNSNSIHGRFLILQISYDMIKDQPMLGYGYKGFEKYYMNYQAEYIQKHSEMDENTKYLADNIKDPLNVFVKIVVNHGIVGLCITFLGIVFLLRRIFVSKHYKTMSLMALFGVIIFMFFSYPFNDASVVSLLCVYLVICLFSDEKNRHITKSVRWTIVSLSCVIILHFSVQFYYQIMWGHLVRYYYVMSTEEKEKKYTLLYSHRQSNPYFLYNYARYLYDLERYDDSAKIAQESCLQMYDYESLLIYAEALFKLKEYDCALKTYEKMSFMVPCKFLPLYRMFEIYKTVEDSKMAYNMANRISTKKVKIPSIQVLNIKKIAERYLKTCEQL